jgi:flagellar basal body-associated protein FliL
MRQPSRAIMLPAAHSQRPAVEEKNEVRMKPAIRSIVLVVGLGAVIAALAVIGAGFWFFASHRSADAISAQLAENEFSQLRARFSGQPPLLDMSRREASEMPAMSRGVAPLRLFHTVIFDTRGGQRIVRITVPYWFARHFAGRDGDFRWLGQLTFLDDTEFDPEAIRLSLDQLERRGPGLVADYRHPGSGQFISWVE